MRSNEDGLRLESSQGMRFEDLVEGMIGGFQEVDEYKDNVNWHTTIEVRTPDIGPNELDSMDDLRTDGRRVTSWRSAGTVGVGGLETKAAEDCMEAATDENLDAEQVDAWNVGTVDTTAEAKFEKRVESESGVGMTDKLRAAIAPVGAGKDGRKRRMRRVACEAVAEVGSE